LVAARPEVSDSDRAETRRSWIGRRFARLSTGLKMLLILSAALFPLGLLAIAASVESASQKNEERRVETQSRLEIKAHRLDAAFSRSILTIRTASAALGQSPPGSPLCTATLRRLEEAPVPARYAFYDEAGRLRCASAGFALGEAPPAGRPEEARPEILPGGGALRLWIFDESGRLEGIADFARSTLHTLTYIAGTSRNFDLGLSQPGRLMVLRSEFARGPFVQTFEGSEGIAEGRLKLSIKLGARPFTAADLLAILLPVVMWLFAALIGWIVVERLLLRPLGSVQRAVSAYRPGDRDISLPPLATPAREIRELGEAFEQMVRTVARHEAELEAAVERQTRLVREVHHRVKNNLQVVASLLNLHARGTTNEQVAAAYASIQRRVDALAVVHRNHYAELEENRGVSLKSLISELAANLRATAPAAAASMVIRLDIEPYYATQDVAVSVAFLLTEIVEYSMLCGAPSVAIALGGEDDGVGVATLMVEADSLRADVTCEPSLTDRFERIVAGLSRQLRTAIDRDTEAGRYALDIAVVARAEAL
jgi:two-component sensor histidine kinase